MRISSSSRINAPNNTFPPQRNYMVLTLADVLAARQHYHLHLAHLPNVVGTAVGRYLIHEDDWYATHPPTTQREKPKPASPRTLFNTVTQPWSWPCVLVFLNQWQHRREFGKDPDRMVPRALYLPDGRVVPTCTVLVHEAPTETVPDYHLSFANSFLGGGYLAYADVQGQAHLGSIACLVTDGDLTYALTNRHVTGAAGRELYTNLSGKRRRIGVSAANQVGLLPFEQMYPGWPGANVQLHVDAGLIRIDDIGDWTTQVAGMGPLGEWLDMTTDTLTLDFVGEDVRAFGAASGELKGRIAALFYRYTTAGGTDYVTDFLIRPRSLQDQGTLRGDSGTLWFWEQWRDRGTRNEQLELRPFAMQWGGHAWVDSGRTMRVGRFALAAALSPICRELDVTLLRDWNTGLPEYWGPVGHYTIGYFACDGLPGNLGKLMKANQTVVSYPLEAISSRTKINERGAGGLVPLADVPDRLWAHGQMIRGSADKPNHFADMDQRDPKKGNKTLLQLCEDPANVTTAFWLEYYADVGDTGRGCLPFRVWQFFDEMVDAVRKKDATRYVCAAGILAHYVGDACQPLHISYLHDGEPQGAGKPARGKGVHTAYEETMLRQNAPALLTAMKQALQRGASAARTPPTGQAAAVEVARLMQRTFKAIKPIDIVDAFDAGEDLWNRFGTATVEVMTDGVRTLRAIWRGAWNAADGETRIAAARLVEAPHKDLIKLYTTKTWMPSKSLKTIGAVLKGA
jgi:hypothetical protein